MGGDIGKAGTGKWLGITACTTGERLELKKEREGEDLVERSCVTLAVQDVGKGVVVGTTGWEMVGDIDTAGTGLVGSHCWRN